MNIKAPYLNITRDDITTFEQTFKVRLPAIYSTFLLAHNGGVPDNIFFLENDADVVLNEFLPLHNSNLSIESYLNDFHFNLQHLIPIAEDAFGNLLLMDCNSDHGSIHFWNHETTSVRYVTDSFEYFIGHLQKEAE